MLQRFKFVHSNNILALGHPRASGERGAAMQSGCANIGVDGLLSPTRRHVGQHSSREGQTSQRRRLAVSPEMCHLLSPMSATGLLPTLGQFSRSEDVSIRPSFA